MSKTLSITEGYDPNYLAVVVTIKNITPHSNADKLECTEVFGNNIIIGKGSYSVGETVVYFPVESCISLKFLSWANLLEKPELNSDQKTKGYFDCKKGRVRAVSLRSLPSQGFLFKVSELAKYYDVDEKLFKVGDCFNCVGDDTLVTKWVKETKGTNTSVKKSRVPKWVENTIGVFPRPVRIQAYKFVNAWYNRKAEGIKNQIVDGQFAFHYSTEVAGKNIYTISPTDNIIVSEKLHGCNGIYGNILCKKTFNPIRSFLNFLGAKISNTEYKFIYSSRNVIKNRRDGKYTDDVWGRVAEKLDGKIPENIILYGEVIGWSSPNKNIQKGYDYSVPIGEVDFRVFRIVRNNPDGSKSELPWVELNETCDTVGVNWVPVHYKGLAKDMFDIPVDENWHSNFLTKLKEGYFKSQCDYCINNVVNEGVVIRNESSLNKTALKYKNPDFLIKESSDRDKDEENLDEAN